jgi:hypothetical protein
MHFTPVFDPDFNLNLRVIADKFLILHRITGTGYGLNYHFDKNVPVKPFCRNFK